MKTYKVDLDYESSLFDPRYLEDSIASQKIIKEFEYVFFLVNKEHAILKNLKSYKNNYLEHLRSLGFFIPEFNPKALLFDYWWGFHHDKELEKKLNSKFTSAKLALENEWGFTQGALVQDIPSLLSHLQKFPERDRWILKRPYSFSGIGHTQFNTHSLNIEQLEKILFETHLLEPVYDRVFDIGTTFEVVDGIINRVFMVENFNSSSGAFKGGAGASDVEKFKKYIFNKYKYSLDELEATTNKIANYYLEQGALSNIQIDSFVFREGDKLKLYTLVEVNYRKTMGLVIQSIAEKYSEADWIEWRIESSKIIKSKPFSDEWIRLSPEDNHFQSYFKEMYFS